MSLQDMTSSQQPYQQLKARIEGVHEETEIRGVLSGLFNYFTDTCYFQIYIIKKYIIKMCIIKIYLYYKNV